MSEKTSGIDPSGLILFFFFSVGQPSRPMGGSNGQYVPSNEGQYEHAQGSNGPDSSSYEHVNGPQGGSGGYGGNGNGGGFGNAGPSRPQAPGQRPTGSGSHASSTSFSHTSGHGSTSTSNTHSGLFSFVFGSFNRVFVRMGAYI